MTGFTSGMKTSLRGNWKTPTALYRYLTMARVDVTVLSAEFDGLRDPWPQPWFANPPYGREIVKWTAKMPTQGNGVALLPARTDTRWFHEHVLPYARIDFLRGRLHFDDAPSGAPFPSMLCYFGDEHGLSQSVPRKVI